ncbi:hypothetical protein NW762_007625 [Fusarium torreyae]|uniref:Uncharacterized protein n=1 Tax=Fusarium torreyae TaxID=1237075 RepID=A0A9W8S0G2_9HYPO|nr:hypothetical protein NW762_007625 [Fusarium torreyae]
MTKSKQVHFEDAKEATKSQETTRTEIPPQVKSSEVVILTWKDEECRFVINVLSRFLRPLEIPKKTHLIEHRPWNAGGVYTVHSTEPILPNTSRDLTVRVKIHHDNGFLEVYLATAGGLEDTAFIPPVQWLDIPPMELVMVNGPRVLVQIEDSVHGQWLATCLHEFDLLVLREGGVGLVEEVNDEEQGEAVDHHEDPMDLDIEEKK